MWPFPRASNTRARKKSRSKTTKSDWEARGLSFAAISHWNGGRKPPRWRHTVDLVPCLARDIAFTWKRLYPPTFPRACTRARKRVHGKRAKDLKEGGRQAGREAGREGHRQTGTQAGRELQHTVALVLATWLSWRHWYGIDSPRSKWHGHFATLARGCCSGNSHELPSSPHFESWKLRVRGC